MAGSERARGANAEAALPLVTLHVAQSLDGRIGLGRGRERAILSSEEGVLCAHRARGEHDAVLVGIETLLHDDPLLTARGSACAQPLRVVLDSELRTPPGARLFQAGKDAGPVLIFAASGRAPAERQRALEAAGASVLLTDRDGAGRVQLTEALASLAERGVRRLLVEGGACVLTAFLRGRLAQRAEIEIAPLFLGSAATPTFGDLGVAQLGQAFRLERTQLQQLGASLMLSGDIAYPAAAP